MVIHGVDGVMEMEDDPPGLTVWPKLIATCTRVARKQWVVTCGEESRTNTKLSISYSFRRQLTKTAGLDARLTSNGADSTH